MSEARNSTNFYRSTFVKKMKEFSKIWRYEGSLKTILGYGGGGGDGVAAGLGAPRGLGNRTLTTQIILLSEAPHFLSRTVPTTSIPTSINQHNGAWGQDAQPAATCPLGPPVALRLSPHPPRCCRTLEESSAWATAQPALATVNSTESTQLQTRKLQAAI